MSAPLAIAPTLAPDPSLAALPEETAPGPAVLDPSPALGPRAQAIADGRLIPLAVGSVFGFVEPIAITAAAWQLAIQWTPDDAVHGTRESYESYRTSHVLYRANLAIGKPWRHIDPIDVGETFLVDAYLGPKDPDQNQVLQFLNLRLTAVADDNGLSAWTLSALDET